jgi:hypothetical protein
MPTASIWIDAPALPISWHHGWWFGCAPSASGAADFCRLVKADGEQIYAGEYLRCSDGAGVAERDIRLVTPRDSSEMWLFGEGDDGVVGFLDNGDLLVPKSVMRDCTSLLRKMRVAEIYASWSEAVPAGKLGRPQAIPFGLFHNGKRPVCHHGRHLTKLSLS